MQKLPTAAMRTIVLFAVFTHNACATKNRFSSLWFAWHMMQPRGTLKNITKGKKFNHTDLRIILNSLFRSYLIHRINNQISLTPDTKLLLRIRALS